MKSIKLVSFVMTMLLLTTSCEQKGVQTYEPNDEKETSETSQAKYYGFNDKITIDDFAEIIFKSYKIKDYNPDQLEGLDKISFLDEYKEKYRKQIMFLEINAECKCTRKTKLTQDDFLKKDANCNGLPIGTAKTKNGYEYELFSFGDEIIPSTSSEIRFFCDIPENELNGDIFVEITIYNKSFEIMFNVN